jgi:hypothetical protein
VRDNIDRIDHGLHARQQYFPAGMLEHEPVGEVVDVFRGAGEVDKLPMRCERRYAAKPLLDKVLDGFDVVVGGAFNPGYGLGIGGREIQVHRAQPPRIFSACGGQFPDFCGG